MKGVVHKKIGIETGVAAAFVTAAIFGGITTLILGLVMMPWLTILTSQLPDMDSNTSRISRRIPIIKTLKSRELLNMVTIALFICLLILGVTRLNIFIYISGVLLAFACIQVVSFSVFKHRALLHSYWMVAFFFTLCMTPFILKQTTVNMLLGIGLGSGYASHVIYDRLKINKKRQDEIGLCIARVLVVISILVWIGVGIARYTYWK